MPNLIMCALTFLGCVAYIFIAGMTLVKLRMQDFSLYNEKSFPYAVMEATTKSRKIDHITAALWPLVGLVLLAFIVAERIYKFRR